MRGTIKCTKLIGEPGCMRMMKILHLNFNDGYNYGLGGGVLISCVDNTVLKIDVQLQVVIFYLLVGTADTYGDIILFIVGIAWIKIL